MTNQLPICLKTLEHCTTKVVPNDFGSRPIDIYLLPFTFREVQNIDLIQTRSLIENQILKYVHLREVYTRIAQLAFSALVMTHQKLPPFKEEITEAVINAAGSATLLPDHSSTLDEIFESDRPTKIKDLSNCSYYDFKRRILDLNEVFFRSSPFSNEKRGRDLIYSGWAFRFGDDSENSISVKFDPWFKYIQCSIITTLWTHFGTRFTEDQLSSLQTPALESRMAAYVGIGAIHQRDFIHTVWDLFAQCFDLHAFEYLSPYDGTLESGLLHGIIGTRKETYQTQLSAKHSINKKPKDIPEITS